MWPMRASPSSVSGINVGCFRPNDRSARARRPPTFISPSSGSMKGILASIVRFYRGGSWAMEEIPLGHTSFCICCCRAKDASLSLGRNCCSLISDIKRRHISPFVTSSVACLVLGAKYDRTGAVKYTVASDVLSPFVGAMGGSLCKNAGPFVQFYCCRSFTEIGRVQISAGLTLVGI